MRQISHNALQPLGTHCACSQLINIHEPSDEYANGGESGGVQVNNHSSPIRGRRMHSTSRGGRRGRKWHLRASKGTHQVYDF